MREIHVQKCFSSYLLSEAKYLATTEDKLIFKQLNKYVLVLFLEKYFKNKKSVAKSVISGTDRKKCMGGQ